MVFLFRWTCNPWLSGVTMLVRWLCSFPASEMHVRWLCSSPASEMLVRWLYELSMASGNAPHGKDNGIKDEPTNRPWRHFKGHQRGPVGLAVTGFWARNAPLSSREGQSARELLDLHFHRGPVLVPVFKEHAHNETCEKKAKTKARGPNPEENRQRDIHQARRRSRKEKYPQVAQNGLSVREFLT